MHVRQRYLHVSGQVYWEREYGSMTDHGNLGMKNVPYIPLMWVPWTVDLSLN